MQIYEITKRTQPVNEVLSALGAMAGGIAKAAAQQFTQSQLGTDTNNIRASTPDAFVKADAKTQALIKPLADKLQKSWNQTLQVLMTKATDPVSKQPVTSVTQMDANALTRELWAFLNAATKTDLTAFAKEYADSPDPQVAQQAKQIDTFIRRAVNSLIKQMKQPGQVTPAKTVQTWVLIAQMIQSVQHIKQFAEKAKTSAGATPKTVASTQYDAATGKTLFNGQPYNVQDASHRAAVKAMGGNPDQYRG